MAEFDNPSGVDLRALLDEAIGKIEPLLRAAADAQSHAAQTPCTWCPICKAAAAMKGHEQEVFASLASQGGALLNVLKEAVGGMNAGGSDTGGKPAASANPDPDAGEGPGFTEIPVTIKP